MDDDENPGNDDARGPSPALGRSIWRALAERITGQSRRGARGPRLKRHALSVVACDLRGFTRFSASVPPDLVVELLREHYQAIGEVVASFRGTIKDHAGDGTLVLVGAARPTRDHADRAVALARAIAAHTQDTLRRASDGRLGLGIGVASGDVTVGSIEAGERVEPVAVGAPVNLAARLCKRAQAGQILVDEHTVAMLRGERIGAVERLELAELKGFASPVSIFRAVTP